MAASSAGAKRANARTIAASDLRMAWMSLPTELARAFAKRASVADNVTGRMVLRCPGPTTSGAESTYRGAAWYPRSTPRRRAWRPGYRKVTLVLDLATYWMTGNTLHVDGGENVVG
jgi:hypothetical protein